MRANSFDRRRKIKFIIGVLAFGLIVSAIVGVALVLMSGTHPRF